MLFNLPSLGKQICYFIYLLWENKYEKQVCYFINLVWKNGYLFIFYLPLKIRDVILFTFYGKTGMLINLPSLVKHIYYFIYFWGKQVHYITYSLFVKNTDMFYLPSPFGKQVNNFICFLFQKKQVYSSLFLILFYLFSLIEQAWFSQ